jgi:hypothetical protein
MVKLSKHLISEENMDAVSITLISNLYVEEFHIRIEIKACENKD